MKLISSVIFFKSKILKSFFNKRIKEYKEVSDMISYIYIKLETFFEYYSLYSLAKLFLRFNVNYLINTRKNNFIWRYVPLIDNTKNFDNNFLSSIGLIQLKYFYKYCLLYGKFLQTLKVRKFYLEELTNPKYYDGISFNNEFFKCLLEKGKYKDLTKIANQEIKIKNNKELEIILSHAYLLLNDLEKCEKIRRKYTTQNDFKFAELIANKSIAIIGPGIISNEKKKEIDKFDLLICLNSTKYPVFKCKYKVSYYNCEHNLKYKNLIESVIPLLDYACFKLKKDIDIYSLSLIEQSNMRVTQNCNNQMIDLAISQMIQNILYDIFWLPTKIKFVKIFAVDFFTQKNLYEKSYPSFGLYENKKTNYIFNRGIRLHNPFSNINFVKSYFSSKLIDLDKDVKDVLLKSLNEYASILDNRF